MTRLFLVFFSVLLLISVPLIRVNTEERPEPVKAKLLADASAIAPGATFELAVLFEIDPHWHVYWKNPGDSGLPTSVVFMLPEGFKAGDIRWPVPSVLKGAGGLNDYGYEDSLLLSSKVTAPSDLKPGSTVEMAANVSWISCKDICIPGRTKLELKLPVSDASLSVNSDLFAAWRERLPLNYSGARPPFEIGVKTEAKNENVSSVSILLHALDDVSGVDLYPVPGNSFLVDNIVVETNKTSGETSVNFDVKRLASKAASSRKLETLIVYKDKAGKSSAVELPVSIGSAK
jgi:DsbC/DsbD-like thiol-disulfide interchange protein